MNGKSVTGQIGVLLGIVVIAVIAIVISNRNPATEQPNEATAEQMEVLVMAKVDEEPVLMAQAKVPVGASVLQALEAAAAANASPIGVKEFPFGKLVVSIAGVTAGADGDWTYRVNDTLVPVAANSMHLNAGDRVVFRFGGGDADSLAAEGGT